MKIENIDKYFSQEILRRGYSYYKNGKVKEIIKNNNNYVATVKGTEDYQVKITIKDKEYDMECTCPYAEEDNCKHMAAVLYCLKNNNIPIKENIIKIESKELTDFDKITTTFKKEYYKLFHNRSYLHENEIEDYQKLISNFTKEVLKQVKDNDELLYKVFEYLIINIDSLDVYDRYGEKENIFDEVFNSFWQIFNNKKIFLNLIDFIKSIYIEDIDEFYFEHKVNLINIIYNDITEDWQANYYLILLTELEENNKIYDYQKSAIKEKIILTNYYFFDKEKTLLLAERYFDEPRVCNFILEKYPKNEKEEIKILEKIIAKSKKYNAEKYYDKLLIIYQENNKEKYIEILKKYLLEYKYIETYQEIKRNMNKKDWEIYKNEILTNIDDKKLYREICIEEKYYDKLVESLEGEWIEVIDKYKEVLIKECPKEVNELYKQSILRNIIASSDRKGYQRSLSYIKHFKDLPNGQKEMEELLRCLKDNYKNRSALLEEIEFFEDTYM